MWTRYQFMLLSLAVNGFDGQTNDTVENGRLGLPGRYVGHNGSGADARWWRSRAARKRVPDHKKKNAAPRALAGWVVLVRAAIVFIGLKDTPGPY